MVDNSQLARSKSIHRQTGPTFYFATRVLPERVRRPTYVLYAFFRIADEVVDNEDSDLTPGEQRARLADIRDQALGRQPPEDPVLAAFSELREEVGIEDEEVEVFVDAMLTDIEKTRYETYEELEAYMRGSASAVGEMMTTVMNPDQHEEARPYARALGEAFQLTNFLRDVREDIVDRGRIYLPQETLRKYDVTDAQLERFEVDEAFREVMRAELRRAEGRYREGVAGIKFLPRDCQFAVLLAAVLYAEHHRLIRGRDYDVLSTTPQLSTARKTWVAAKTRAYWAFSKDPETVFAKVSAIPMTGDRHAEPGAGEPQPVR
ncbi:phytoene/squalene synthase family protein [Halomarina ordinaria]|uniref:Phytoene/squalene synthase family protein n=1 Tax=Halomarina ordinaria TaxID=3033939 RepID=A0ABD5U3T3_9EURY|nr:phytoene/squalene synthase family protein [Halomarina sp. PSRA2]